MTEGPSRTSGLVCLSVRGMLMWIITPCAHQWPWMSEKTLQILIFADKAQSQGGRNEFYFVDLSHSTDYIPLHLRCLRSAHSSSHTDNMGPVIQFYSLTYRTILSQCKAAQFALVLVVYRSPWTWFYVIMLHSYFYRISISAFII